MKKVLFFILLITGIAASVALTTPRKDAAAVERAVLHFREGAKRFTAAAIQLQQTIQALNADDSTTVTAVKRALKDCRLRYKSISFFLGYFFQSESAVYNMPAKYEIEEPYMEYQAPTGLQVIEALIYDTVPASHKEELQEQAGLVVSSARDLPALLYAFKASDAQLLESLRLELVRVIALYISGFDAPFIKTGIDESYEAIATMQYNLQLFREQPGADSLYHTLGQTLIYLDTHRDFDSFNRLVFLTKYALPLQRQLGNLIRTTGLELNTTPVLNYQATHVFSKDAFTIKAFPGNSSGAGKALELLGNTLFFERALSGNNVRSCASCHRPDQHFASGLAVDTAFDGHAMLTRNTPTLLYACYQHAQFWDGKVKSLEEQVLTVLGSPVEMNISSDSLLQRLHRSAHYLSLFRAAFPDKGTSDSAITMAHTATAIAAYLRTLVPMHSAFDRYLAGDTVALTAVQQHGFNLFMGKAQCGTCHFAPLFNGLTPPLYDLTEFEVAGTTLSDAFDHPQADADEGRFGVFPISFYKRAFKTPTVRNAAATAPYMHNGRFSTLRTVVDFYDKGGGAGLGLPPENQTLSAIPLQLSEGEKEALVRFMEALTDQ